MNILAIVFHEFSLTPGKNLSSSFYTNHLLGQPRQLAKKVLCANWCRNSPLCMAAFYDSSACYLFDNYFNTSDTVVSAIQNSFVYNRLFPGIDNLY